MSVGSIPIYPANLATSEENWIFRRPKRPQRPNARSAQTRYDVIWNFTPIYILSTLRIFYVKMAISIWGERVCWDKAQLDSLARDASLSEIFFSLG